MSIEHLSEGRIQECLDNRFRGLSPTELKHIKDCEHCQGLVMEYKLLYAELAKDRPELLPTDFTSRTMAIIRQQVLPAAGLGRSSLVFAIGGLLSCLAAIIYLFDIKALLNGAASFSLESAVAQSGTVGSLSKMTTDLGPMLPILIFAGLILVGVAVADKLLLRQKTTRAYFLSV
ncbi:MAG: hypothetical protein JSV52_10160 [Candidatus Zixiibacteriota bacterium]|nr:MAG: hypothetical protein JSV52_10160 [candidate division Zixibacteria bacterium]